MSRGGSAASPIQKLPVEILTKIFVQCIYGHDLPGQKIYYMHPRDPLRSLTYINYPTPLPFLLSHVCSIWRAVALSSPILWALLETPSDSRKSSSKAITRLLHLWISRSGNMPLCLHVCSTPDGGSGNYNFMKALSDHLRRVENMTLTYWCTAVPFTRVYGDAPSLRSLKLETEGPSTNLQFPFYSCPQLRHLEWPSSASLLRLGTNIPWAQLTQLRLDDVTSSQAVSFLSSCPQLVDVRYKIEASPNSSRHRIKHENLRQLALIIGTGCDIHPFIDSIILPSLTNLQLEHKQNQRTDVLRMQTLVDMLTRSECHLLHLDIAYLNYNSEEFRCILEIPSCLGLRTLKSVARIMMADIPLTDELLTQLSFSNALSDEVLCPDLEMISFMNYGPSSPGALGRMVASRFKYGSMKSFSFYPFRNHEYHDDWKIIHSLAKEGFDVAGYWWVHY